MKGFQFDKCLEAESRIPVDFLHKILEYDRAKGILIWRKRNSPWPDNFDAKYAGLEAGTPHKSGAIQVQILYDGVRRLFWAHRIIWAMCHGEWPKFLVDHEDGDNHNNRIDNLREADGSKNGMNRRAVVGKVPYRGVYAWKDGEQFGAQIKYRRKWKWLGLHSTAEDAARAYDEAAIMLHGEFAVTNRSLGLFLREEARLLL